MKVLCGVLFLLVAPIRASAQLDLPVPLHLTGTAPEQRQVTGLAMPAGGDAGLSVDAVRTNYTTYTTVTGTTVLAGNLTPAAGAYVAGMSITIVPTQSNLSSAQIDLNGLGPVPIVKLGGLPLDSADLIAGAPHRLIYDGQQFQLLSTSYLPCPAGFHVAAREYCIEDSSRAAMDFYDAGTDCISAGGRLCSFSEWLHACLSEPGFIGTVLDFEWVDNAANNTSTGKTVGNGSDGSTGDNLGIGCKHGHHSLWSNAVRYRCCFTR